jgi:putative SOS response-associated peptidase YedK
MEWGIIPFYIKEEDAFRKQRASMLNVRSERIFDDQKSYWFKIRNRRCLIPVTGFYEHRTVKGFKNKIPYHIAIKDKSIFYLPGLYSVATLPDKATGEIVDRKTFAILTTSANRIMQEIHNSGANTCRMPLMLADDDALRWLEEDIAETDLKGILKYQITDTELTWQPVFSLRTNKQREDGKSKNEQYNWPGLEALV